MHDSLKGCIFFTSTGWQPKVFGKCMNAIVRLIVCLFIFLGWGTNANQPVLAQQPPSDPVISLTVKDEPLIDVLDTIAEQTGYEFNLTPQWEDHPVSATINHLPLEQGLKRLLRSLNHTILWEADKVVTIKVYGKATPGSSGSVSFAAPPQDYPQEDEPPSEPENEPLDEDKESMEGDENSRPDAVDQPEEGSGSEEDRPPVRPSNRPARPNVKE
jgi:hypothetical protein